MTKEKEHSLCSPSSSERWLNCPGSLELESQVKGKSKPSVFAEEGTRAHAHAERLCRLMLESGDILDEHLGIVESEISQVDQKMHMMRHILFYVKECYKEWKRLGDGGLTLVEEKLVLDEGLRLFGTADFLAVNDGQGVVMDLKYGSNKAVIAENNPQLAYYAVAIWKRFPGLRQVKVKVVQPRCIDQVSSVIYTSDELSFWKEIIIEGANKAVSMLEGKEEPVRIAGSWCQFCRAKGKCKERREHGAI